MLDKETWRFINEHYPVVTNIRTIAGDAGNRSYYRLTLPEGSVVLVNGRSEPEGIKRFFDLSVMLADREIPVAEIYARSDDGTCLLMEDLGDTMIFDELFRDYDVVMPELLNILGTWQKNTADMQPLLKPYSADLLREEMNRMHEWFFPKLLYQPLNSDEEYAFACDEENLINIIGNQPRAAIHRDFHSRNLMLTNDSRIVMIDYQDAVWGCATYDLVSLTRDCYINYPKRKRDEWEENFRLEHYPQISRSAWRNLCNACALQRHLKVLGLFVRLAKRDRKPRYLRHLLRVWNYVLEESKALEALVPFIAETVENLDPLVRQILTKI